MQTSELGPTCCFLLRHGYISDQSVLFPLENALLTCSDINTGATRPFVLAINRHLCAVQKKEKVPLTRNSDNAVVCMNNNTVKMECIEQDIKEATDDGDHVAEVISHPLIPLLSAALEVMTIDDYEELFEIMARFAQDHWGMISTGEQQHAFSPTSDHNGNVPYADCTTALKQGLLQGVGVDAVVYRQLIFKYRVPKTYVSTLMGESAPINESDRITEEEIETEAFGFSFVPSSRFVTAVIADGFGIKAWLQVVLRFLELGDHCGLGTTAPFTLTVYRRDREQKVADTSRFLDEGGDIGGQMPRRPLFDPVQVSFVWGRHSRCTLKTIRLYCKQLAARTMAQRKADEGTLGEKNLLGAIILRHSKSSDIIVLQTMRDEDKLDREGNTTSENRLEEALFPSWGQLVLQCRNAWMVNRPYFRYVNTESRISQGLYETITITENANYLCWKYNCPRRKGYCPELFVYEHCPLQNIQRSPNPVPITLSTMLARGAIQGDHTLCTNGEPYPHTQHKIEAKYVDQIIQNLHSSKAILTSASHVPQERQTRDARELVLYHKMKLQALLDEEERANTANRDEIGENTNFGNNSIDGKEEYIDVSAGNAIDANAHLQRVYVTQQTNVSNKDTPTVPEHFSMY